VQPTPCLWMPHWATHTTGLAAACCRLTRCPAPGPGARVPQKHAVFMTRDGRISLAGLSSAKVDYLADAIVDSVKNVSKM